MQKSILRFLFIVGFCYSVPSVLDSIMSVDGQQGSISSTNTAIIQEASILSPEEMVSIRAGYGCGDKCTVNQPGCATSNCVWSSNIRLCDGGVLTTGYILEDSNAYKDCELGVLTDYCPNKRPTCACRQAYEDWLCLRLKGMVETGCSTGCGQIFTNGCQGNIYDPCS